LLPIFEYCLAIYPVADFSLTANRRGGEKAKGNLGIRVALDQVDKVVQGIPYVLGIDRDTSGSEGILDLYALQRVLSRDRIIFGYFKIKPFIRVKANPRQCADIELIRISPKGIHSLPLWISRWI
jgi:hypothetical protein